MGWMDIEEDDPLEDTGQIELHEHPPKIVSREEWGAEEPKSKEEFESFPVPFVVDMHTGTRPCYDKEDCKRAVKEIQEEYMSKGEPDILYKYDDNKPWAVKLLNISYLLDMEGNIYIGRGPSTVSMLYPEDHKKLRDANKKSIAIGVLGNGVKEPTKKLIRGGASLMVLLFEGNFIDEKVKFVCYQLPTKGLPVEQSKDQEDVLMSHVDGVNREAVNHKEVDHTEELVGRVLADPENVGFGNRELD